MDGDAEQLPLQPAPRRAAGLPRFLGTALFVMALLAAASLGWWLGRARAGLSHLQGAGQGGGEGARLAGLASFRLPALDGKLIGPRDLEAKVVVLDFWATWCAPCAVQAEILRPLHEQYAPKGVEFLAVNMEEEPDLVKEFVANAPFPYPVVLDRDGDVSIAAGVTGLPTLFVLRDGQVVLERAGIVGASRLRQVLDSALSG